METPSKPLIPLGEIEVGSAYGNRTRLSALRGPCPEPIDERANRVPGILEHAPVVSISRKGLKHARLTGAGEAGVPARRRAKANICNSLARWRRATYAATYHE